MIRRTFAAFAATLLLAGCGEPPEIDRDVEPIGDFRLGYNIVVASDVQKGPTSRNATEDELADVVRAAMEDRVGRYNGDGLYHIGLRVEAYALGRAGVPLVYAPRSIFILAMNIWDDATQEKLNEEPIKITAFDGVAGLMVGGGIVRDRELQMRGLAWSAALEVERVLKEHEKTWFAPKAGRERVAFRRDPATGRLAQDNADQTNLGRAAEAAADAVDAGATADEALEAGRAAQADG